MKVTIEFEEEHLKTIASALEVYSRLRSGQISIAMDLVYYDANLSWDERVFLENSIRCVVFPAEPRREYDGHGGFYDQYGNVYNENGIITEESEEWKLKKDRHHLDYSNSYFGVAQPQLGDGTVAWEIKKVIEQYQHYQRNDGYRNISDVSGDGPMNLSKIPIPKVLNFNPQKTFKISRQKTIRKAIEEKNYKKAWKIVDESFKKNPLPKGKSIEIKEIDENYCVVINEPYKMP